MEKVSLNNNKLIANNVLVFNKENNIEEMKDVVVTYVTVDSSDSKEKDYKVLAGDWSKKLSSFDGQDTDKILAHFLNLSVSNTMIQQMNNFEKPFVLSYHRENTIGCEGVIPLRINPETKSLNSTLSNEIKMGVYELGKGGDIQVIITSADFDIGQIPSGSKGRKDVNLTPFGIIQYEVNPFNTCIGLENDYFKGKKIDFYINDTEIEKRKFVTNNNGNNLYSVAVDPKDYLKGVYDAIDKLKEKGKSDIHVKKQSSLHKHNNVIWYEGNQDSGEYHDELLTDKEGKVLSTFKEDSEFYFKPKPITTNFSADKVNNNNKNEITIG